MSEYTYNQTDKGWVVIRKGLDGDTCRRICICDSVGDAIEIVAERNFCAGVEVPDKAGGLQELITAAREMEIWSDFVKGDPPASNALKELREALKPFDYMIDEKGGEA